MDSGDNEDQKSENFERLLECEVRYGFVIEKIRNLIKDNETLKLKETRLSDRVKTFDFEQRASRETTLRLSGELNKALRERELAELQMTQAKKEAEQRRLAQEELEAKSRLLEDRVKSLTHALGRAHSHAEQKESHHRRLADNSFLGSNINNQKHVSPSATVSLVSDSENKSLQEFLQFIRRFLNDVGETSIGNLLTQAKDLIVKSKEELDFTKSELSNAKSLEKQLKAKDAALRLSEKKNTELSKNSSSTSAIIESLQEEGNSMRDWLARLADILKLEELTSESERALLMSAVAARVKVLMSGESEKSANQRAKLTQMQQRSRELKERNESLEIQLNLLRKRLSELEEANQSASVASATNLDRERRRLLKQLEQVKAECVAFQADNARLKAEQQANAQQSLAAVGSSSKLQSAESQLRDLRRQCDYQKQEIATLMDTLAEHKNSEVTLAEKLRGEIKLLRAELDCVKRSEFQLLEFRAVIASLLDMGWDDLAAPDFEIAHRLEHILQSDRLKDIGEYG